jgi:hypothetical protein
MFMIDLNVQTAYKILGISPDADAREIIRVRGALQKDLKKKIDATRDEEEKKRLNEELLKITGAGEKIARPAEREKYDAENAHLMFYQERPSAMPFFTSKADRLWVLLRAFRAHLAQQSVTVSPLNDLDREDFSADETPNELLDHLLR